MKELYSGAEYRPVSYHSAAGAFNSQPLGWILHVVVGNGTPYNTFQHAVSPHRRFSHFWVAKNGHVEQYAPCSQKSWAQGAGNTSYWSIETEGFPNEPLSDAQITALAKLHNWLGAPNQVANKPGARGIGTHYMGGSSWGGHTCPDPGGWTGPRSHQRVDILDRAAELRHGVTQAARTTPPRKQAAEVMTHDPLAPGDVRAIADAITGDNARYQVHVPHSTELAGITEALGEIWRELVDFRLANKPDEVKPQ